MQDASKLNQQYQQILEEKYKILIEDSKLIQKNQWEDKGVKKSIQIHKKIDKSGLNFVRGEGIVPCSTKTTWHLLYEDVEAYKNFDASTDVIQLLEVYDSHNYACYNKSKPMFGISARDLITLTSYRDYKENGYLIVGFSIDHEKDPNKEKKDPVRVDLRFWGFIIEQDENNPNYSRVIYMIQINAGGWIPVWIQNMFSDDQALVIRNLADYVIKNKLK